jgi:hypothetical protein
MDLVIRNATLADGRHGIDIGVAGERIAAVEAGAGARARAKSTPAATWSRRPSSTPISTWTQRSATACRVSTRIRHLARRHRALGRAETAAGAGSADRTGVALLRLGGGARPAGDPHPRRYLRRPAAGRRGPARSEAPGGAVHRPAAGGLPAGRPAAQPGRLRQPEARDRDGRGRGRRHPAFRAHHGAGRGIGAPAVRVRGRQGPARRHALRRDRRPAVAPHRNPGLRDLAPRAAGQGGRLAPDLDAFDGQLLCQQAAAADANRAWRRSRIPSSTSPCRAATTPIRSGAA